MSVVGYRAAVAALKALDEWTMKASRKGAAGEVQSLASLRINLGYHRGQNQSMEVDPHVNAELANVIRDPHTLYRLAARARAKLAARVQQLHIDAANEARAIIRENPPK